MSNERDRNQPGGQGRDQGQGRQDQQRPQNQQPNKTGNLGGQTQRPGTPGQNINKTGTGKDAWKDKK